MMSAPKPEDILHALLAQRASLDLIIQTHCESHGLQAPPRPFTKADEAHCLRLVLDAISSVEHLFATESKGYKPRKKREQPSALFAALQAKTEGTVQ